MYYRTKKANHNSLDYANMAHLFIKYNYVGFVISSDSRANS